jgi:hypothetical protein
MDGGITFTTLDGGNCNGLDVQPAGMQTITVNIGQMTPTVMFTATLNCNPASPAWGVDKGNVGTVPATAASSAVFTPTGTTGGVVTVSASLNGQTVKRQILVKLTGTQNGPNASPGETGQIPTTVGGLTAGGGVGGVGGEGLGTMTDPATVTALGSPVGDGSAQNLAFLYPYDQTVWPRGILAPLLQWTWAPPGGPAAPGDADAIKVDLATTTGSFTWSGTFGRPAILSMAGGNFLRMPIPQDVWAMATETAGGKGDQLKVSLTVAKGGMAYGPISETWTIAPARLDGTIYYQSYGTQLVTNYNGALGGNGSFGAGVLSIHVGDSAPTVAAGLNTTPPDISGCRVCHSVAAGGASLVVQQGSSNDATSFEYKLPGGKNIVGNQMSHNATYPAVYPDGTMALTTGGLLLPLPGDATPLATVSPPAGALGSPMFSPDGSMLAYAQAQKLLVTSFSFDATTKTGTFGSTPTLLVDYTSTSLEPRPGWPAFFPDSKSVVFHHQTKASACDGATSVVTRSGALAQIYWSDLSGTNAPVPLDNLNGTGYLPQLATPSTVACTDACTGSVVGYNPNHSDDVDVNYEPTVAPVASGGYAWVVFTSRRMYGTVATIGSFCSDPRGVNLINNITPKKLWVAAIDLTQAPGADSSHPAFYLPAQEILAGNARGFWTLDPCLGDGASCMSGDQCCNGFCEPGDGGLVCGTPPTNTCSGVGDRCTTAADCCDPTNACINGFCALSQPQ